MAVLSLRRAFAVAIVLCGCTHDYAALNGDPGGGGAGGGGGGVGAGGSVATAGRGGGAGGAVGVGGAGGSVGGGVGTAGAAGTSVGAGGRAGTGGKGGSPCASGELLCSGGACIPPGGDGTVAHCGGCNACPVGATSCNSGVCGCSVAGQMVCSNACVDTRTNNAHCGGCNRPCSGTCTNGNCVATMGSGGAGNTGGTGGGGGRGGTTGTGGTSGTTCGAAFAVGSTGFVTAPAAGGGCWHGYAFAGGDVGSSITPANFSACGTPCSVRMTGTVGAATAANNYSGVAYLGFNLAQDATSSTSAMVTPTGSSVTIAFAATTAGLTLRAQLSGISVSWCYVITGASPVTIPYSAFNTNCWDNTGPYYAKQPIQNVQLVVPGGATATTGVSVTLTSVREN